MTFSPALITFAILEPIYFSSPWFLHLIHPKVFQVLRFMNGVLLCMAFPMHYVH